MAKIIKSFKKFESFVDPSKTDIVDVTSEKTKVLKTFGPSDFKEYLENVDLWTVEHNRRHFGAILKEDMWKNYVKPGIQMSLVQVGESGLATVLHKGNEIIKAVDENDNDIDLSVDFRSTIKESKKYRKTYENMTSPSMSFTYDEFDEYLQAVKSWEEENGVHKGAIKSEGMWDTYVKPGVDITLVDIGKKMVSVIHRGSDIISAFDQNDEPVDKSIVSDRMSKFFE